jgi:hypothetical protein
MPVRDVDDWCWPRHVLRLRIGADNCWLCAVAKTRASSAHQTNLHTRNKPDAAYALDGHAGAHAGGAGAASAAPQGLTRLLGRRDRRNSFHAQLEHPQSFLLFEAEDRVWRRSHTDTELRLPLHGEHWLVRQTTPLTRRQLFPPASMPAATDR